MVRGVRQYAMLAANFIRPICFPSTPNQKLLDLDCCIELGKYPFCLDKDQNEDADADNNDNDGGKIEEAMES